MSSKRRKIADDKPWETWNHELPTCGEFHECKEYKEIADEELHRSMNQEIRTNAFQKINEALTANADSTKKTAVFMAGGVGSKFDLYDTDCTHCPFRQESYFQYLFGVNEPDCFGVLDMNLSESILFVPFVPEDWERWNGENRPLSYYKEKFGVDHCFHTSDINKVLLARGLTSLCVLYGQNNDSDNWTDLTAINTFLEEHKEEKYTVNKQLLHTVLTEMRVIKTKKEQELLRAAAFISNQAHVYVMRHVKPGMTELQLEVLFKAWTGYYGGSRHVAYTCVCACGPNGSTLHYGHAGRPNDRVLNKGDIALLDMGAEYYGYTTDITRSYPVDGKFSKNQASVFRAVRAAQIAVFEALKPGVAWTDMHRLAERTILTHLIEMGVLHNGTVDQMMEVHMGAVFMPHGLGHFIGLDTHDVGGYAKGSPSRSEQPGLCWLRTARTIQEDMYITVEPGLYFNDSTLKKALANEDQVKYINTAVLQQFRGTGGVRLEDNVLITADGIDNFTVLPSTVEEIEEVFNKRGKTGK